MLDHFVWSVVVVPALTVVVALLAADLMPPRRAAAVLAWSAALAAAASSVNLFLLAIKAFAELPSAGRWFGWSSAVILRDPPAPWISWLSIAVLLWSVTAFFRTRHRHRRARAAVAAFTAMADGREVFVVPDPAPEAFSVEGPPGRIVVTTGMVDLLTEQQYAAMLAHEREHLDGRHHRLARMAELAGASHPLLRILATRVDYLVERAADEKAAASVGDRRSVALAVGAAALAGTRARAGLHLAERPGVVPRRVRELLHPRRRRLSWLYLALPAGLAVFSAAWTGEAVYDLAELFRAAL